MLPFELDLGIERRFERRFTYLLTRVLSCGVGRKLLIVGASNSLAYKASSGLTLFLCATFFRETDSTADSGFLEHRLL